MLENPIITISREYGSGGREIGRIIARKLGINFYDRELITMASQESGVHVSIHEQMDETLAGKPLLRLPGSREARMLDRIFSYQSEAVLKAARNSCVIVGRCADYILRGRPNLVRLYIYASWEARKKRVIEQYGVLPPDADATMRKVDKERAVYYNYHTDSTWGNVQQFDLCINTTKIDFETAAELAKAYIELRT